MWHATFAALSPVDYADEFLVSVISDGPHLRR